MAITPFCWAILNEAIFDSPRRQSQLRFITGKLKQLTGRPADDITDVLNAYRALCVIDLETNGWKPRDAAIEEAKKHLKCSYSTIEKALKSHGEMLKAAQPEFLDTLRSAFK